MCDEYDIGIATARVAEGQRGASERRKDGEAQRQRDRDREIRAGNTYVRAGRPRDREKQRDASTVPSRCVRDWSLWAP